MKTTALSTLIIILFGVTLASFEFYTRDEAQKYFENQGQPISEDKWPPIKIPYNF